MPDRVKTQCCTLVISGKGVVNFPKWICGNGREFNVCVIPLLFRGSSKHLWAKRQSPKWVECPSQRARSLVTTHLLNLLRLRQATQDIVTLLPPVMPRLWSAFTVGQMGLCQPAGPERIKYLRFWGRCKRQGRHSGQRSKSYGFRTMLYFPGLSRSLLVEGLLLKVRDSSLDEIKLASEGAPG